MTQLYRCYTNYILRYLLCWIVFTMQSYYKFSWSYSHCKSKPALIWSSADLAPVKWSNTNGKFSGSVLSGLGSSGAVWGYPVRLVWHPQNWESKRALSVEKDLSMYLSNLYGPFETEQNGSNLVRFKRAKPNAEISVWSRRWSQIERNPPSGASPNGALVINTELRTKGAA